MIQIIEGIKNYSINNGDIPEANFSTKKTVTLPIQKEWKQFISFNYKNTPILIDLYNRDKDSLIKTVDYDYINNSEIMKLAEKFNPTISESSLYQSEEKTNYLKAGIANSESEFKLISLLECNTNYNTKILIFYRIDAGDSRSNPSLYIH